VHRDAKQRLQVENEALQEQLKAAPIKRDEVELDEASDCELVEWFDFLKWLKPWVESKPKKGQWIPTKADAEAVLHNVKKPKEPK